MTDWKPQNLHEVAFETSQTKSAVFYHLDNNVSTPLLLHGPCGTGKSTLTQLITEHLAPKITDFDFKKLEACDDRSNAYIKGRLTTFCRYGCMDEPFKRFVIIEELDELSHEAQISLSGLINRNDGHIKFMFSTNHLANIKAPLVSRSDDIYIGHAGLSDWVTAGQQIMADAGYPNISEAYIEAIIKSRIGDNRKVVTQLMKFKSKCDELKAT